ncbi:hypothetical protein SAMN05661096_01769 [Marivirga sericea]|uniref:Uncharacterized protein n=1 Tax=Marivirga sericea TaxID=1028 RepID=A0A1X7JL54_9BACT|nr:hypothetical protein SAMN05661096_01769 [Marivirga sericea]
MLIYLNEAMKKYRLVNLQTTGKYFQKRKEKNKKKEKRKPFFPG